MLYYVYIISYTFFFFFHARPRASRVSIVTSCVKLSFGGIFPFLLRIFFFFLSLCARAHVHLFFFSLFFFFQINVTCDSCIKCTFVLSIPMFYTCICTSFIHSCFIHIHVHIYMYVYIYMRICICIDVYVCVCVYVYVLIRVCARA